MKVKINKNAAKVIKKELENKNNQGGIATGLCISSTWESCPLRNLF